MEILYFPNREGKGDFSPLPSTEGKGAYIRVFPSLCGRVGKRASEPCPLSLQPDAWGRRNSESDSERKQKMEMKFFMIMNPPTATAQEKQVKVIHGKPIFYEPDSVKKAKMIIMDGLMEHVPDHPISGPVKLTALWCFPKGKSHKDKEWRTTKPDTDNLQKLLKDCMTRMHYWRDDAQVVHEEVGKVWADFPTGILIKIEEIGRFMDG